MQSMQRRDFGEVDRENIQCKHTSCVLAIASKAECAKHRESSVNFERARSREPCALRMAHDIIYRRVSLTCLDLRKSVEQRANTAHTWGNVTCTFTILYVTTLTLTTFVALVAQRQNKNYETTACLSRTASFPLHSLMSTPRDNFFVRLLAARVRI